MITLLYFARLRTLFGRDCEDVELPPAVTDVQGLLAWLRDRGEPWVNALGLDKSFRVAVNQEMAGSGTTISDGDEIAVFPPVTGG